MWSLLKRNVAELRDAPPGQRFRARYRAWRARRRESRLATVMYLSAGVFAVLLGIVFSFWPVVPGFVFVLMGLAILSARLGWLAHRLDRLELAFRRRIPVHWLRRRPRADPGTRAREPGGARRRRAG